ncbi:HNH endonuclease signature motif containing protein [Gemmata sp. JC717]|uniref:HNH endonuclease n=1 Tax=Gemmata algarum TaxID=2975278 RepID=UPI0021BA6A78|nr:HNH endonuclease signature motif containing protein [Gemmata algarum]MDY3551364.1 HNH endonuclease signature motif containing protein [Gemmata algarum]
MTPAAGSVPQAAGVLPLCRDRLRDLATLTLFKRAFLKALDRPDPHGLSAHAALTESERLLVVPLVFGLMPAKAVWRGRRDERIKPHIRDHLASIGLMPDEVLVDILKTVADQYYETQSEGIVRAIPRKRKYGIADIKAMDRGLYHQMVQKQCGRCAVCGILLDQAEDETLDHILPWRLVGDIPSGSNWQILCQVCNSGKRAWFSALQSPESMNWIYSGHDQAIPHAEPTRETRYVVLAQLGVCQEPGCMNTPAAAHLRVRKCLSSGLAVVDNLTLLCDSH